MFHLCSIKLRNRAWAQRKQAWENQPWVQAHGTLPAPWPQQSPSRRTCCAKHADCAVMSKQLMPEQLGFLTPNAS